MQQRGTVLTLTGEPGMTEGAVYLAVRGPASVNAVVVLDSAAGCEAGSDFAGATVAAAYTVETFRHWDDGLAPGVVRLAFVAALPAVDGETFRRRYLGHAPIARVQHPGICRYVQHFVVGGTEPVCAAIAELHFADDQDMRERFYRDADSAGVVDADIGDYLDRDRTWSVVARPLRS